jgi:hypothetical protein
VLGEEVIKMAKKDTYSYGRAKERKVAQLLRKKGASVEVSKGSRGAADLKVTFPTGRKWNVQVKAHRRSIPASPSAKELQRLRQGATRSGATPVVANVTPKGVKYTSARSGRKLTPATRKRK